MQVWIWLGICLGLIYLMSIRGRYPEGILLGCLLMALANLAPQRILEITNQALTQPRNLELIIAVGLISMLNSSMNYYGQLRAGIESLGIPPRLRSIIFPLLLGMFPAPGGALLSAPYVGGADPSTRNFLNLWYRHLIFLIYPYAPAMMIASSITGLSWNQLCLLNLWIFGLGFLAGMIGSRPAADADPRPRSQSLMLMPIPIALAGLILGSGLIPSLILGILFCLGLGRFRKPLRALTHQLDPKLMLAALGIILFKSYLISILDPAELGLGGNLPLVASGCFLLGFLTGVDILAIGLGLSLALPLQDPILISILYVHALLGYIISPLHLCLVLSCKHFGAGLIQSYRKFLIPYALVLGACWLGLIR